MEGNEQMGNRKSGLKKNGQKINVPLYVILRDYDHLLTPKDGRVAYDLSQSMDKKYYFSTTLIISDIGTC